MVFHDSFESGKKVVAMTFSRKIVINPRGSVLAKPARATGPHSRKQSVRSIIVFFIGRSFRDVRECQ